MKRFLAGLVTFGAFAGSVYLGSRLGPTTAPAPAATVTQAVAAGPQVAPAPPVSGTSPALLPPLSGADGAPVPVQSGATPAPAPPPSEAPVAQATPVSAPAPAPAPPALQSAPESTWSESASTIAIAATANERASVTSSIRATSAPSVTAGSTSTTTGPVAGSATSETQPSPTALPYTTQRYLHDPFTETAPPRSRAFAATSSVASDAASPVTSAATSDPNDWTNCAPSDFSPAPDAAGQANIRRANEWSAAASGKAASLGLGAGRYDWLRCRGDVMADWLAAGGPEPLGWLGRRGFDSPLATCSYQITVNRPAAAAQYPLVVTMNGSDYAATLASCDPSNAESCTFTFSARCELQRQPIVAKWVGPSTTQCLHGGTKTASDGPCEVQP